jgi:phage antirepressor YoqD-like protein
MKKNKIKFSCIDVTFKIEEVAELLKLEESTIEKILIENEIMQLNERNVLEPTKEYKQFFKRKSKKSMYSNFWIFSHYEMNADVKEFLSLIK